MGDKPWESLDPIVTLSPDWEQRRWEMAKELTIRMVIEGVIEGAAIADAIDITDRLIEELKSKKR